MANELTSNTVAVYWDFENLHAALYEREWMGSKSYYEQRYSQQEALINIRAVMDYAALRERLEAGELAGAVLDVFEEEPLPPQSPWWTTRNVIVMPHISCDSPGYMDRLLDRWFANFQRHLEGKPLENIVDRQFGY